jgi:hypothetical protein
VDRVKWASAVVDKWEWWRGAQLVGLKPRSRFGGTRFPADSESSHPFNDDSHFHHRTSVTGSGKADGKFPSIPECSSHSGMRKNRKSVGLETVTVAPQHSLAFHRREKLLLMAKTTLLKRRYGFENNYSDASSCHSSCLRSASAD